MLLYCISIALCFEFVNLIGKIRNTHTAYKWILLMNVLFYLGPRKKENKFFKAPVLGPKNIKISRFWGPCIFGAQGARLVRLGLNAPLHIVRMNPTRYPKVAMEGYAHGQRGRGRPKKRWMNMIEQDCEMLGLNIYDAKRLAQDRAGWKNAVKERSLRTNVSPQHYVKYVKSWSILCVCDVFNFSIFILFFTALEEKQSDHGKEKETTNLFRKPNWTWLVWHRLIIIQYVLILW